MTEKEKLARVIAPGWYKIREDISKGRPNKAGVPYPFGAKTTANSRIKDAEAAADRILAKYDIKEKE